MHKILIIDNCSQCYSLSLTAANRLVCKKSGKTINPKEGIPKDCPLKTVKRKGK